MTTTAANIPGISITESTDCVVMLNQIETTGKATTTLHMLQHKNEHFYGRAHKIEELEKAVEERKRELSSISRTIVLTGFGGMGKSEIVKAFVETFQKSYDYIAWIDARTQQNVEASFKKLAKKMDTQFKSLHDVPEIQRNLAKSYKKGLFIFDNAERLYTADGQFGIKDYLYPDILPSKPIFIAISRNGSIHWGGSQSKITFINVDAFTIHEASNVLKNYLRIGENVTISESLGNAISLLVETLGRYPLGLHLVGSTIVEKAEKLSFIEMELRIKSYADILKDASLQDISADFKYETALELIYKETISKINSRDNGAIAIELLNIMACLDLDEMYLGLVDAIYSGTTWEGLEEDSNPYVTIGLQILLDYSIVNMGDWGKLKMQRMIQQCTSKTQTFVEAIRKMCSFFELNENNNYFKHHIMTLIDTLTTGMSIDNKNYILCMLVWRLCLENCDYPENIFKKCKYFFNAANSQEPNMFKLADVYYSMREVSNSPSVNWDEIESGILHLPQLFKSQFWVTRSILAFLKKCLEFKMPLPHSVRESINSFVINQCLDFPVEKLETLIKYPDYILLTLYGFKSSRNVCEDSLFLSKLWNSPREESRTDLLEAVWILHSGENGNQDFIPNLSSICGKDFFPPSSTFCYPELQRQFVFNNQYSSLLGDRHHEGAPFIVPVSDHQEKPSNAGYGPLLEDTSPAFNPIITDKKTRYSVLDEIGIRWGFPEQLKRIKPPLQLHITLFSVIVGIVVLTSVFTFVNVWERDFSNEEILPLSKSIWPGNNNTKTELEITSALDFKLLEPFHTSVRISVLEENYDDFLFLELSGDNVQQLSISGSMSFQWLHFVTREFPTLRKVTLDMDEFCSLGNLFQSFNDKIISFEAAEAFSVRNFKRCNSDPWIFFQSLNFPKIKYFVIEDSSLDFERYEGLTKFLKNHQNLFHVVTFQRCYICEQCKVLDIPYPNSEIEIFNRRADPFV